jgi:hypothetical protein
LWVPDAAAPTWLFLRPSESCARSVLAPLATSRNTLPAPCDADDVLMVTRLDRLARSTRDLLNTLSAIADRKAGFRSLGDAWADTTTSHVRLMLTVLVVKTKQMVR